MILISHRGNINGPKKELENNPIYIQNAIDLGYQVEIDIWKIEDDFFLGHEAPEFQVSEEWIKERSKYLWCHCKDLTSVEYFSRENKDIRFFWHENDKITLTSKGDIWAFPGNQPIRDSISVLPEIHNENISESKGICSDFLSKYRKLNVALLISGQVRNAKETYPSIKEKILDIYNPDVFIETWSNSSEIESHFNGVMPNDSTLDEIEKMYNPKILSSEEYSKEIEEHFISRGLNKNTYAETKTTNLYSMHYKIKKGFNLIEEYQSLGKCYDIVIRIRFDIRLENFIDLYEVNPNKVYIPEGWNHRDGINDLFAIGGYEVMKKYCNLYSYLEEYSIAGSMFHPETLLKVHLEKNSINIERPKIYYFLREQSSELFS
jgi:hypothetical protein